MSGIEVLGLVLGILPLIISAIEHYDDILRPINRYRRFTTKAARFHDELETEQTIFEAECQLLLGTTVADVEVVKSMLRDSKHPSWNDETVCRKFRKQLGTLGPQLQSVVSKIHGKLDEIGDQIKESSSGSSQMPTDNQSDTRAWLSERRNKLKFAFTGGRLSDLMNDLRILNKTFRVMSNQITRFDEYFSKQAHQQNFKPYPQPLRP